MLIDNYNNIIFNLYGTLIRIENIEDDSYIWEKLSMFMGYLGAVYEKNELRESYLRICKSMFVKENRKIPELNILDVFEQLFREKSYDIEDCHIKAAICIFRALSTKHIEKYNEVDRVLSYLKMNNKNVYIFANGQRYFSEAEFRLLDIEKYIDGIHFSSDIKIKKPDSEFFRAGIEKFHIDTSKSLMVTNNYSEDSRVEEFGVDTIYIHTDMSPVEDEGIIKKSKYILSESELWRLLDL